MNDRMGVALDELEKTIARYTEHGDLTATAISGLSFFRRSEPSEPDRGMYEPSVCVIAQGAKRVVLGDDTFVYDVKGSKGSGQITAKQITNDEGDEEIRSAVLRLPDGRTVELVP